MGWEPARKRQVIRADGKRCHHGLHHDMNSCRSLCIAKSECGTKFIKPAARMPQALALRQDAEWPAPALGRANALRTCL